jgi:hypothetical protein
VQVQVFLVQRRDRHSWHRTSGGPNHVETGRAQLHAGVVPPTDPAGLHPFEKHGESNTTEAAAPPAPTPPDDDGDGDANDWEGGGNGVRRGDPGGTEGDNGKWAATRSMIRGDGTRPRLPAWIFVPSSPPYLSPPAWIFPDSLRTMNCDLGAAGALHGYTPIALGFGRSSSDRPLLAAAAVEMSRSRMKCFWGLVHFSFAGIRADFMLDRLIRL